MIRGELLVALAKGQALGRLNETARPLGEFLDIHALSRSAPFRQRTIIRPPKGTVPSDIWERGTGAARPQYGRTVNARP